MQENATSLVFTSDMKGLLIMGIGIHANWEVQESIIAELKHFFHNVVKLDCSLLFRFPLKAVKVMHTVALRTEASLVGGETPSNLGQVFKVRFHFCFSSLVCGEISI